MQKNTHTKSAGNANFANIEKRKKTPQKTPCLHPPPNPPPIISNNNIPIANCEICKIICEVNFTSPPPTPLTPPPRSPGHSPLRAYMNALEGEGGGVNPQARKGSTTPGEKGCHVLWSACPIASIPSLGIWVSAWAYSSSFLCFGSQCLSAGVCAKSVTSSGGSKMPSLEPPNSIQPRRIGTSEITWRNKQPPN